MAERRARTGQAAEKNYQEAAKALEDQDPTKYRIPIYNYLQKPGTFSVDRGVLLFHHGSVVSDEMFYQKFAAAAIQYHETDPEHVKTLKDKVFLEHVSTIMVNNGLVFRKETLSLLLKERQHQPSNCSCSKHGLQHRRLWCSSPVEHRRRWCSCPLLQLPDPCKQKHCLVLLALATTYLQYLAS